MIDPNKTTNGNPDPGYEMHRDDSLAKPWPKRMLREIEQTSVAMACEGCGRGYMRSEMPDGRCVWCEEVEANAPDVSRSGLS